MLIKVNINGKMYDAEDEESILLTCLKYNIFLPHLCYLKKYNPSGRCGLCIVEIDNPDNVVFACSTKITKDMNIITDSASLKQERQKKLSKILKNHTLDCLRCFKSGNCSLQMYVAMLYKDINVENITREANDKEKDNFVNLTDKILFNKTKCINCNRCNRFLEKECGIKNLENISNATDDMYANVVDVCATAALKYDNKLWKVAQTKTIDTYDVSNIFTPKIRLTVYKEKIISITSISKQWIANDIRFNYNQLNNTPILNKKTFFIPKSIDIETFFVIKYIVENNKDYKVIVDDSYVPRDLINKVGFLNVRLAQIDAAIFVGIEKASALYYLRNYLTQLRAEFNIINLNELPNVSKFNYPHVFIDAGIFPCDISILKNIPFSIIPKGISHMMTKYLEDYISGSSESVINYNFLASSGYYFNAFGEVIKIQKIINYPIEKAADWLKVIYQNSWRDVLEIIHNNIRSILNNHDRHI